MKLERLPLWLLLLLCLLLYPLLFPLLPYHDVAPTLDVRTFTPSLAGGVAYALLFLIVYALYWLATRQAVERKMGIVATLGVTLLLCLPLLLTYPINANDIYRYVIRGRITAVYGENPLAVAPTEFSDDPFLPLAGEWAGATSPYGPVWESAAAAITWATGGQLLSGLLGFKLLAVAAHVGAATLIWYALSTAPPARRLRRTLLWAWNPALLFMFVVDGHNDALMLFWLLAGYTVAESRGRRLAGLVLMMLAPLTKMIALLPLPFFFIVWLRQAPDRRQRIRFALAAGAAGLMLVTLAFLPFGSPLALIRRLLFEAGETGGFSPAVLLLLALRRVGIPVAGATVARAGNLLFLLVAVILLLRVTWRGATARRATAPALTASSSMFAAYVTTAYAFRIWYTTWLVPWLLLHPGRTRWLRAGLLFLLTAHLSVVIYGHVRVAVLGGDQLLAHLIAVPFVFLVPLLFSRAAHSN